MLPCQPGRDPARPLAGMFPLRIGLLQETGEEKVYLGKVHLREKRKRGNLSSQLPFPLVKVYATGAGSITLLGSGI